ncbi:MAG: DUF3604 domain-containing protein [Planctomycetota bacterium]|jgi:hypothetical protein
MFKLSSGPEKITTGNADVFKISYRHSGNELNTGSVLRLAYNAVDGASVIQIANAANHAYFKVDCPEGVTVKLSEPACRRSITFFAGAGCSDLVVVEIEIISGSLKDGDTLDFIFGNDSVGFVAGKGCDTPWELFYSIDYDNKFSLKSLHPDAESYLQFISADGTEVPEWRSSGIKIEVVPDSARYADLVLPSSCQTGRQNIHVTLYDRFYNNLPDEITLPEIVSENETLMPAGEFYIENIGFTSANPVMVKNKTEKNIYWGELHGHSSLSDGGRRGPDDFFSYAKEVTHLDFASLADHSFGLAVGDHWQQLLSSIEKYNKDNEFAALPGYEIMPVPPFGHRNIYFPDTDCKLVMADFQPGCGGSFQGEDIAAYKKLWNPAYAKAATLEKFFSLLEDTDFIWTAHHCGEIAEIEKERLLLYEACSEWGISEESFRQNCSKTISSLFAENISPAFTGGSDDHRAKAGFKGSSHSDLAPTPYSSGLTAVFSPELDRYNIYTALKNKHCYATTGARILLIPDVKYENNKLHIDIKAAGTDILERFWIFKNGKLTFKDFLHCGTSGEIRWEDPQFSEYDNCYIRIKQQDGEIAWINPLPFAE